MGHRLVTEPLFTYTPPMRGQLAMATEMEDEMEAKHTPGPWEVRDATDKHSGPWLIGPSPVRAEGYVCALTGTARVRPEAEANARLIAAAPDLLAACRTAAAMLGPSDIYGHVEYPQALAMCEAAIAKAEAQS